MADSGKKNNIFFFSIVLVRVIFAGEFLLTPLPENATEAELMVSLGQLDSLLWTEIKQYYYHQICVPYGELSILKRAFPELPENLPVKKNELSKFYPWTSENIKKFFKEYSYLVSLEPILRFDVPSGPNLGVIDLMISGFSDKKEVHSAHINFNQLKFINIDSKVEFTDELIIWKMRHITINPSNYCDFQIGNFDAPSHSDLFFGYFPTDTAKDNSFSETWRYGNVCSWNGFKAQYNYLHKKGTFKHSGTVFFHSQRMERIYGCNFDCQLVKKIDWHLSFSGLELDQNNKPKPYCNTGVSVKLKSFTVEARSGININEPEIIPLFFDCLYSSDVNKFRFSMKFLPEKLYAPRSRVLYRLYDISEPVNSTLTEFKLLADNFFIQWLTLSSSISLLLDESLQKSFDATFMIKGIVDQLTYKLAYSWLPSGSDFDSSTIILRGSINHRLHRYFNVDSDWRVSLINHDHYRYNLHITPKIIFPHSIELEPFVAFSGVSDKRPRVSGGVKQVFTLLKHISTEFTCIFPLCEGTVRGKVDVNAKMWFLF